MIHIVFNESEVDLMKQVIEQDVTLAGEVIQIKDDFAVGPLTNIDNEEGWQARVEWWRNLLQGSPYKETLAGSFDDRLTAKELKDKLGKQLKSFTDWLRSMKSIGPIDPNTSLDEVTNQSIQRIAEHSVEEKEVLTEAMAEVWIKQGNADKAIRVYEKLSLLNPAKSPYFAGRIEQLKAQ
jgi:hypothetical protein